MRLSRMTPGLYLAVLILLNGWVAADLFQIEYTNHAPATAAPRKPTRPNTGNPSKVGPPSTVSVMDEPTIVIGMDLLGTARQLAIDYRRREIQIKP